MRYVYMFKNLINDKVYIGQTINPSRRKASHIHAARTDVQYPLQRSIRKHGVENFSFEVIEECVDEKIDEREKFWISQFDSRNPERGYNIHIGGSSSSEETHRKISEALKGNTHCVGRVLNIETKLKLSKAGKGKKRTLEQRLAISKNNSGRKLSDSDVVNIRNMFLTNEFSRKELSKKFDVTIGHINAILRGTKHSLI